MLFVVLFCCGLAVANCDCYLCLLLLIEPVVICMFVLCLLMCLFYVAYYFISL